MYYTPCASGLSAEIGKIIIHFLTAQFPHQMVNRQRQNPVIDKHGHTEFNKIGDDIDVLPGNEQDKAGQDQVQEGCSQHDEQRQQLKFLPLLLVVVQICAAVRYLQLLKK